jgi:hypothetical protein
MGGEKGRRKMMEREREKGKIEIRKGADRRADRRKLK